MHLAWTQDSLRKVQVLPEAELRQETGCKDFFRQMILESEGPVSVRRKTEKPMHC